MLRGLRRVVLAVLLLVPPSLARAQGTVPNGYQVRASVGLHEGVEHLTLTYPDPGQTVQVAHVAPGAPVAVKTVSAHDAIPHRTAEHELPSDMCRRVACIAGINGDFHDLDSEQPLGGVVSGGRLVRSPRPGHDQVTVARDGTLHAGLLGWSGSLTVSNGTKVALTGMNVDRGADGLVLYTREWGASTPAGAENEFVLRAAGPVGALGTTAVEIVGTRRSSGAIPSDGAVLSATGPAGAVLRDLAAKVGNAVARSAQLQLQTSVDAVESLGVHPVLLRNGRRAFPDNGDGFARVRNPRTLLGWNPSGEIVMVTVDGRRDEAEGMSLAQAADLLLGLGATDGVNFDGGGGTTFVVAGEVKNLPSDDRNPGPPAYPDGHVVAPGHVERMAPNALVLVANPTPTPPPANPGTSPDPGGTTATTAPAKLTTAGGGPALAPGTSGTSLLPGVSDILRETTTKRPRRKTGKGGKGNRTKDGQEEEYAGDPSIPDWNDITAALTPEAVPGRGELAGLSFGVDPAEDGPGPDVGAILIRLFAAGMIVTVLWRLQRARSDSGPQRALWL